MTDNSVAVIRRAANLCGLLASLPLLAQLPLNITIYLLFILGLSALLAKAPHRLILFFALLATISILILEFKGRYGRDVAACMLALMMALKCLETKSIRDLRALLGFSLFLPFAALLNSQAPITLALSLINFTFWLFLVHVLSTGRIIWPTDHYFTPLKSVSTQILLALPLALALFWLFPRISTPLWGMPSLSNQGTGLGDSMKPGQWLDTLTDDRIAFRATFKNQTPRADQRYWRGPVLWDFDGLQWTRKPEDSLPVPDQKFIAPNANNSLSYAVSLEATERKYLPSLDWPSGTADEYSISKDGTVYSDKPIQKITRYSGVSILEPYSNAQLDLLTRQRALAFPKAFNKRTQSLAKQWRSQSGNDRAYIARVMQWIRKDFSYTLATKEPGINATDDFLFTDKKGFCQHFSSSFALLMRAAGIPSRVVTGYVGGYKNPYGDYWILYNKDAHAWNEVWLEGEGWVRFDPTAAVAPENILDTIQSNAGQEQYFGDQSVFSPMFDYSDFIKSNWNNWVLGFNAARQEQLFQGIGLAKIQRWQMLILLLCVAGGISYVLFLWIQTRAREKLSAVERAWQKLLLKMHKRGMGKLTYETALNYAQRIGAKDLILIAERYTQWRYGKTVFSETDIRALIVDISRLKITSNSSSKPAGQWRASQ